MPQRVAVVDTDSGHVLFTGTVADTSTPWMMWHRVVADGPIDLPPKYSLRPIPRTAASPDGRAK